MSRTVRELGLALQTNKRPGEYAALARPADDAGFAVVTVYNDLWYQPALPALLERWRTIELAAPRLEWIDSMVLRGMKAMPLRVRR